MRSFYAGSDVVVVPSVPTRDFLEPWGLVVNEAFDQGVPVIATTAVGAAAGGLVRNEQTGLVVPAGDAAALAAALRRLHGDPELRARLGAAGRAAVAAGHSHADWAAGMSRALAAAEPRRKAAASVARAMPRLLLVMVLTLLVAAPAAMAGTRADIIADCFDDGKLDGNYTASQIRDARNNLPADVDQYSDCRDVLARALGGSGSQRHRRRRRRRRRARRRRRRGPAAPLTPERPGGAARARRRRPPSGEKPVQVGDGTSSRARRASPPAPRATSSPPACSPP